MKTWVEHFCLKTTMEKGKKYKKARVSIPKETKIYSCHLSSNAYDEPVLNITVGITDQKRLDTYDFFIIPTKTDTGIEIDFDIVFLSQVVFAEKHYDVFYKVSKK